MLTILFAPGTNSYLPQLSKYTSVSTDQEKKVYCPHSKSLWSSENCVCVQFAEIYRPSPDDTWDLRLLTSLNRGLQRAIHYRDGLQGDILDYGVDFRRYNLGQEEDVQSIQRTYEQTTGDILAFGVSRGSCALINWIAEYQPDRVKGLVLEGCPTTMEDITKHSLGYHYYAYSIFQRILPRLTSYQPQGVSARDNLLRLPKNIPILLITSKGDTIVPWTIPWDLYTTLQQEEYLVEITILEKAGHIDYLSNNLEDTQLYLEAYHEFLKKLV